MNSQRQLSRVEMLRRRRRERTKRAGVVVVMTGFCLIAVFAFVALSVDASRMVLTETKMQNACDAASLAAAQEITSAVNDAGETGGEADLDANSIAVEAAREMAEAVALANGVYIDPDRDVRFGKRTFNAATGTWPIAWGATPYNVVQVTARRTDGDVSQPDGQLPLAFGWSVGRSKVPLTTSATAFVEARDLVMVLDFSGSMNYDSNLVDSELPQAADVTLLAGMWAALRNADPKWPGTNISKFPSNGFGSINSAVGTYVASTDTATIRSTLGLNANNGDGSRKYPYPQAGRGSNGLPKNKPSNSTSDALWNRYIDFVKNHPNANYRKKYGYRTLMDWLQQKSTNGFTPRDRVNSEDMWQTPHYPMEAVKGGTSLFLEFVENLDFGDEVGLVGYGQWAEQITGLSDGVISVNVSSDPITPDYSLIDDMQLHHQAGEFNGQTNIGDGILKGREMLLGDGSSSGHTRFGSRPTILLMTDGLANQYPSGWSLPNGFNWAAWTDYDGDGDADYSSSDQNKRYAFYQATLAAQQGITIHTLSVGSEADDALMQAIAYVGGGIFVDVPGGDPVAMEADLLEAFGQIASKVPPAKLVFELSAGN
ncbi:MAG TPA: vWA domain-containing protein [Lacipirellulaceae bacterium]|nr:vWA domain-containing protein [Lacipirellulaceae bacterium]